MSKGLFAIAMACLVTFGFSATVSPQQQQPAVDQTAQANQQKARAVLNQVIQALGGQAYLNLQNGEFEGRVGSFYHDRSEGSTVYHRFWQWPDKERVELTKQRDIVQLTIGNEMYEITFRGTRILDLKKEDNLRIYLARRQYALEVVLRQWLNAPGTALFDEGLSLTENHSVERITIINSTNDAVTLSIDTDTHLPVKKSFVIRDPQGYRDEIGEVYDNWKMVQGVNTPYNTLVSRNGDLQRQYFLSSVKYNTPMQSSLFEPKNTYIPTKK